MLRRSRSADLISGAIEGLWCEKANAGVKRGACLSIRQARHHGASSQYLVLTCLCETSFLLRYHQLSVLDTRLIPCMECQIRLEATLIQRQIVILESDAHERASGNPVTRSELAHRRKEALKFISRTNRLTKRRGVIEAQTECGLSTPNVW
jgi:hypothetical protein